MVWPWSCSAPRSSHRASRLCGSRPGRGLVQEQHRGPVEDGPGHHEPLGHPAGQRVDRGLGPLGQLELLQQLVGGLPGGPRADAEQPPVEVQVLPDGELPVERVLLRDDPAELLGQGRVGGDVDAAQERPPGGGHHAGGQHPGRRGLARAVGAEQPEDLARPDIEVEVVDRGEVGPRVDLGQVLGVDDRSGLRRQPGWPPSGGVDVVLIACHMLARHAVSPGYRRAGQVTRAGRRAAGRRGHASGATRAGVAVPPRAAAQPDERPPPR